MDTSQDIVASILENKFERSEIKNILYELSASNHEKFIERISDVFVKLGALFEISNRVSDTLELDVLLRRLIEITTTVMESDRGTLFLNDKESNELYAMVAQGDFTKEIRFPNHLGIAGSVFTTGEAIIIDDAYSDSRFNKEVDKQTGYRTRNILCTPIKTINNEIIGVTQLLNKKIGNFTTEGRLLLEAITSQASAALQNAQLFNQVQRASREETELLEVLTAISTEIQLQPLLLKIMQGTTSLLDADRSTLFVYDEKNNELWSRVAEGAPEIRFPSHMGLAGSSFSERKTINIPDAYADDRFNPDFDKKTGYRTRSILCMPVVNKDGKTIGVIQVLNKKGGPFIKADENRLKALGVQASIAIENAKLFEDVMNMKNYNESILQSLTNGVITLDVDKNIVTCNNAAQRILKADGINLHDMSADEYFSNKKNKWILDSINKVAQTKKTDDSNLDRAQELFFNEEDSVPVKLNIVPIMDIKKEFIGSMLIMDDITEEKRIKSTMARYMTKEVAETLLSKGGTALGGKADEASILFSDIRSFTTISEKIGAQETVALLNDYFTIMVDIIFSHKGILDKYIGDALLAVFGAPLSTGEDADQAVMAGIDMMKALTEFNLKRIKKDKNPIDIGIGLNTDEVLSGNIGSMERMDYTVIGDGVNLAARLESANKYYGTHFLISEFTHKLLKREYLYREIDYITVKGKTKPVGIYEVMDHYTEQSFPNLPNVIDLFRNGLEYYKKMKWEEGIISFEKALKLNAQDRVCQIYLERCIHFLKEPPQKDWDGVWVMKTK
ncbi:adenylate cyclase [Candidatus Magnetomoraceae bacterium gMMP-15]